MEEESFIQQEDVLLKAIESIIPIDSTVLEGMGNGCDWVRVL